MFSAVGGELKVVPDFSMYYTPGALERMQTTACTRWRGTHLVEDAGHWVGEEQPEQVGRLLLEFLSG
jgi:hypothetical protein